MNVVDMRVNQVEVRRLAEYVLHHQDVMRQRIFTLWIEPQGGGTSRHQTRCGDGITAGEQSDIMPQANELFGEPGHNSFSATVQTGWNALVKRRYLCNSHEIP